MTKLLLGDCLKTLAQLPDNSIDAIVTDPPYGLSFMGKKWDYDVPSVKIWKECMRVLKPGGHLLAFAGSRTYHVMAIRIENAGFDIRDQIMWIYGSGFPKSMDVSKAIDEKVGAEREVIGQNTNHRMGESLGKDPGVAMLGQPHTGNGAITSASTPAAIKYQGWGTNLKPAHEPIVVAQKPISEDTIESNVLKWGTGALNIDASRIASGADYHNLEVTQGGQTRFTQDGANHNRESTFKPAQGRWPANIILDEEAAAALDLQSGVLKNGGQNSTSTDTQGALFGNRKSGNTKFAGDSGGASRFFYVAKASKRERNAGLEGMPEVTVGDGRTKSIDNAYQRGETKRVNGHPTVKPIKLMEYLIRLVTPVGGIVLDPFMGSGTTGCAAIKNGWSFVGCELSDEYFKIAEARIQHVTPAKPKSKLRRKRVELETV